MTEICMALLGAMATMFFGLIVLCAAFVLTLCIAVKVCEWIYDLFFKFWRQ